MSVPPLPSWKAGATGTPGHNSGLMNLDVKIEDHSKSVTFVIVYDLAVPLIIGLG